MSLEKTISLGADHGGLELREHVAILLKENGYAVLDHGTHSNASVDYPDFASKVAADITEGRAKLGILICTTGIGISIAANKIKGIRAALAHNDDGARHARAHNDANILCLGGKYITPEAAQNIVQIFINTDFEGGRHERRIDKIRDFEDNL